LLIVRAKKGIYFFKGCLAEVVLKGGVIVFCDLFLALMPTKICTSKNIERPPKLIIPQPGFDCKMKIVEYGTNYCFQEIMG
jgi:hypothetical protein